MSVSVANDNMTDDVRDALAYLCSGGIGEVIGLTSIALRSGEPVVQSSAAMAMALCLLADQAIRDDLAALSEGDE